MGRIVINLLGPFEVLLEGDPVTSFESDRVRALLAYLISEPGQAHRREMLAGLLWPDRPDRTARSNLRHVLANLRKVIGDHQADPPFLLITRQTIQINPTSTAWADITTFTRLISKKVGSESELSDLAAAVDLYRGNFLEGFSVDNSIAFEEWVLLKREELSRKMVGVLRRLSNTYERKGEFEKATPFARKLVEHEPWEESSHRGLMRLLAFCGHWNAALIQYENCKRNLAAELDVEPAAKTKKLHKQIRDRIIKIPVSLPVQTTPFIGRESEQNELTKLLANPDIRLVTILAPGGMGKTRLALKTGTAQFDHFMNGVYFVPLGPLESAEDIFSTIAEAVNFQFYSGVNPKQQLNDFFREKEILLLVDNFEHVLEGAGLMNEILQAARGLKVLVTSRARLNLRGETVYLLRGMAYPKIEHPSLNKVSKDSPHSPGQTDYSAIRLFVNSAQRVRPDFKAHAGNLKHITRICQLVGGMPLGIELAAAWVGMLSSEEIVAEILSGLDFLAIEMQDAPKRHHSIRAVLDRSWVMLDESNQEVFKKLSVFRGGFTLEAAQKIAGASLHQLLTLANQSFIRRDRLGRYQIHKLLRQYAADKLVENSSEKGRISECHCEYYTDFLHKSAAMLFAGNQKEALLEIDNFRAAWRFAIKRDKYAAIRKATFGLYCLYEFQGWFPDALVAFESAADALRTDDPIGERGIAFGQILWGVGSLKDKAGQPKIGTKLICESPIILRRLGAQFELAFANCILAMWRSYHDLDVLPGLQESLSIFQEEKLSWGISFTLKNMGDVVGDRGDYAQAEEYYQESLKISESIKDIRCIAEVYRGLGNLSFSQGAYSQAMQHYVASLVSYRQIGYKLLIAALLQSLGWVTIILGEYELAWEYHEEALILHKDLGFQQRIAFSLENLGDVAFEMCKLEESRACYQEALDILQKGDFQLEIGYLVGKYGNLAVSMGNYPEAWEKYLAALEVGMDLKSEELILEIFSGVNSLLAHAGEAERAVEINALAGNHIQSNPFTREKANKLLSELEAQLPPKTFSAALDRGKALDVETTARQLISVYKPGNKP